MSSQPQTLFAHEWPIDPLYTLHRKIATIRPPMPPWLNVSLLKLLSLGCPICSEDVSEAFGVMAYLASINLLLGETCSSACSGRSSRHSARPAIAWSRSGHQPRCVFEEVAYSASSQYSSLHCLHHISRLDQVCIHFRGRAVLASVSIISRSSGESLDVDPRQCTTGRSQSFFGHSTEHCLATGFSSDPSLIDCSSSGASGCLHVPSGRCGASVM
jgi:hypothetical protein